MVSVVTGAAGHVGSNLCVSLLEAGQTVRAIDLREPVRAMRHGAQWVRADVRDATAMRESLAGCEIVYHLAAVISVVGGLRGRVHSVNVDGVATMARAALAQRVRRVVHCSSVHAFDLGALAGAPADETAPRAVRPDLPAYDRSKAAGEVELRRAVQDGLDAVVVNPTGIIGPCDGSPSRMGSVLLAIWRHRLPALMEGGFDWVDVRDVVAALRAAGERGRTGSSYLVPGHRRSVVELAALAARVAGDRVPTRSAPRWLVSAVAPICDVLVRLTGSPLLPTREAVHALLSFPTVDGSTARRELGHAPRPIEETLTDLYAHFVETGRLTRRKAPALAT